MAGNRGFAPTQDASPPRGGRERPKAHEAGEGNALRRNVATDEGRVLGRKLAQFCDESEPAARLKAPTLLPRCNSCAFREGPHVASGSPETQMDALKCVIEGVEFQCHEPARKGLPCSGWAMMTLSGGLAKGAKAPWPFSDEAEG